MATAIRGLPCDKFILQPIVAWCIEIEFHADQEDMISYISNRPITESGWSSDTQFLAGTIIKRPGKAGRDAVVKALDGLGVKKISELDPKNYGAAVCDIVSAGRLCKVGLK